VTEDKVKAAVKAVGDSSEKVAKHLREGGERKGPKRAECH